MTINHRNSGRLGWAHESENYELLDSVGLDAGVVLKQYQNTFPKFDATADPLGVVKVFDQGQLGSCQGNALAQIFSICYFLATGRHETFSRAAGYYLAQQKDGIRGDNGSTLSGGQWVATQHGMCLDADWPYVAKYNPKMPDSARNKFLFKLQTTKPFRDVQSMLEWLEQGLPIQTGLLWGSSCEQEVVDNYSLRGGGGHSTVFWQLKPSGNVRMINSWGNWMQDGCNEWTVESIAKTLKTNQTVYIGYAPDGMSFPNPTPIA